MRSFIATPQGAHEARETNIHQIRTQINASFLPRINYVKEECRIIRNCETKGKKGKPACTKI
jgi:hypothetical protein